MSPYESDLYENAPIIESVMSVQFDSLSAFRNAHFGAFWKSVLSEEWSATQDAPPIADQFESFAGAPQRSSPKLILRSSGPTDRVQFIHQDDDRVVQLQQTRLLLNWRKRDQRYPRFSQRLADFRELWIGWSRFCSDSGIGEPKPNQWEISYYNHVPGGELWESPSDWPALLPGLLAKPLQSDLLSFESQDGEWHFEIPPQRGRLHVSLQRALSEGAEVLRWTQTARGPLDSGEWDDIEAGLDVGHRAIISAFEILPSAKALKHWKGSENAAGN